jgi:hypothetical protein
LQDPLAGLLAQLEAAVRAGDRDRASRIEWEIRRLLAATQEDLEKAEMRVRELMARLDPPGAGSGLEHLRATGGRPRRPTKGLEGRSRDAGEFDAGVKMEDRDLFLDLARLYPEHAERTTLYASGRDLPVHLSAKLHDAPRAGYFIPYCVAPGVDTIAVPNFDVDLLGHSYFAQAEACCTTSTT